MDEYLEIKTNARLQLELMVALELAKLGEEITKNVDIYFKTGILNTPDNRQIARKIIAIVKEHSL